MAVGAYGTDTINFNIADTGVQRFHRCAADNHRSGQIDGYTQPGSAANTQTVEDDAVLLIELNGANTLDANRLTITAGNSTIRGLVINRFIGSGGSAGNSIALSGGGDNVIEGNFLGIDAPGITALGNAEMQLT